MDQYPYFIYPALTELRNTADPARFARLKMLLAANVGDQDALARLLGGLDTDLASFYSARHQAPRTTDDTIDSFIARFGGDSSIPPSSPLFEIQNSPAPIEESFPAEDKSIPEPAANEPAETEQSLEEVKRLVKNREFGRAVEIMEAIYLNNPKKSVYFADQIRFLRKAMVNESKKQIVTK